jgi:hypothetical protein
MQGAVLNSVPLYGSDPADGRIKGLAHYALQVDSKKAPDCSKPISPQNEAAALSKLVACRSGMARHTNATTQ